MALAETTNRSISSIYREATKLYKNPKAWLWFFAYLLVIQIVSIPFLLWMQNVPQTDLVMLIAAPTVSIIVLAAIGMFLGGIMISVAKSLLEGKEANAVEAAKKSLAKFPQLLLATFLFYMALAGLIIALATVFAGGGIVALLLGMGMAEISAFGETAALSAFLIGLVIYILALPFSVYILPVCILENNKAVESVKRIFYIGKKFFWFSLAAYLPGFLIVSNLYFAFYLLISGAGTALLPAINPQIIFMILTLPATLVFEMFFYSLVVELHNWVLK